MIRRTSSPSSTAEMIASSHTNSPTASSPHQKSPVFRKSADLSEYEMSGKIYAVKVFKLYLILIAIFCITTHCFHYFGKNSLFHKHSGHKTDRTQGAVLGNYNDVTNLIHNTNLYVVVFNSECTISRYWDTQFVGYSCF